MRKEMRKSMMFAMILGIAMLCSALPVQAYTTEVHVVKYTADGTTTLNETTVNYTWMEANLPVHGDGATHYYYQGPIFEDEWENTYGLTYTGGDWGNSEEKWDRVNWSSGYVQEEQCNCYPNKDLGTCKGTDVRDLCNLVGGMSPGDEVEIKASDGFSKTFPYSVIYNNEPALGPYVVAWYSMDAGGATSGYTGENYTNGMRAMFFSDTSTNPGNKHITGIGDMTNYIPEDYWHYYYNNGIFYPALGGYTVKHVSEIAIYSTQTITSCDSNGNVRDGFAPGESVYLRGIGLEGDTDYSIWIQQDPVNDNDNLLSGEEPIGNRTTITINSEGKFGPVVIWSIAPEESITHTKYDIVANNLNSGDVLKYDSSNDEIDSASVSGIVAPIPELATIALMSTGLLVLLGYVYLKRRR